MTLHVGLIADDLTGALDAAAPFAERGLRTRVVLSLDALDAEVGGDAEVLCINTASREISAAEAARRVTIATSWLTALKPTILFKKVDSRLKGHLATELRAMHETSGRTSIILAPAIPDLGRFVIDGRVRGMGVAESIEALPLCDGLPVTVPDTTDSAALDAVADDLARHADTVLAAGARGLAQALAQRFPARPTARFARPLAHPALIAIGSRDPITRAQIDHLTQQLSPLRLKAPNGAVPASRPAPVTLVTAEPGDRVETGLVVAERFAEGLAQLVRQWWPASLLISGGETAYALLTKLGVTTLELGGEALPGIPFVYALIDGEQVVILTKSGGFGAPNAISLLVGVPAELS